MSEHEQYCILLHLECYWHSTALLVYTWKM